MVLSAILEKGPLTMKVTVGCTFGRELVPLGAGFNDVVVSSTVPDGLRVLGTTGCDEDDDPGGGVPACTLGTVALNDRTFYIELCAETSAFELMPSAAITSSIPVDPNGDNNMDDVTVTTSQLASFYCNTPVFTDGFESGDTTAWSSSTP